MKPAFRCNLRLRTLFVSLPLAVSPLSARAAWEAVPQVDLGAVSIDNFFRATQGEQSASRSVLDATVRLANFTERGEIFFEPRIITDAYSDAEFKPYESDDTFLRAGGNHGWQNVSANFQADYAKQNALRAEFGNAVPEDPDAEAPIDGDTGQVDVVPADRTRSIYGGNINFALSARDSLLLGLTRSDTSYSSASATLRRTDYDDTAVTMQLAHRFDERNEVAAALIATQFNADRNDNTTDTIGIEASFNRSLSERWTMNAFAGINESDYDLIDLETGNPVMRSTSNASFGVRFRMRMERSMWNLDLIHTIDPNANGFLTARDQARVFLRHQFTPRLRGTFGARMLSSAPIDELDPRSEREYGRLQVEFEWSATQTVLLTFGVDSIRQRFINEDARTTTVNSAFIGIRYRGLSRQGQ